VKVKVGKKRPHSEGKPTEKKPQKKFKKGKK